MTISKNTNRAKQVIANAHNIRVYALSNNFSGEALAENPGYYGGPVVDGRFTQWLRVSQPEFLAHELSEFRSAKLTNEGTSKDRFCLHIHSNLWYEFDSSEEKPLINHVERIETYQLVASNGKPIRKATKAIFADGYEVKFMEFIPSKTDAINQAIAVRTAQ